MDIRETVKAISRARKAYRTAAQHVDDADTDRAAKRARRRTRAAFRAVREAERFASLLDA